MANSKQLYENKNGEFQELFPFIRIEDIKDEEGKKLLSLINKFNHIYLGTFSNKNDARLIIPNLFRRYGIWISYNYNGDFYTEKYIGHNINIEDDNIWTNDNNWEIVPDVNYVNDASLRIPANSITLEQLSKSVIDLLANGNTIINLADNEDLQENECHVIKFKDRKYSPVLASGKGYKILRKNWVNGKNVLTQEMINEPNTIYEIRYDFDLNGAEINIPEGCVLDFQGGSFNNGKIVLSKYVNIESPIKEIFKDISITTNNAVCVDKIYPDWFNGTDQEKIQTCINIVRTNGNMWAPTIFLSREYNVTDEFDCTYLYDTAGPSPRVSLHIEGANPNKSKINIRPGGNITNKPLFNCTGVNNGTFRNFSVNCDSTVSPYCVFLLMRNDTNTNAGGNTFENIVCLNLYFKYQYLIIGSENDVFIHCNGSVFLDSYVPDENIISDYYIRYDLVDGGCTRNSFFRCDFTSLYLGSGITNTSFIGCYTNREIRCIRSSSNVTFIDIRDETPNDLPATLIIEENVSISNYFIYGSLRKGVLGKKGSTLINCSIKNAAILTSGTSDEIDEDIPTGCCFYLYNSYSSTYQAVGGSVIIRNNGFGNITSNYITHNSIFETDGSDIKYLYLNNKNAIKHINYPARATLYDFNHLLKLGALSYDNEIINIEEDSVITLDPLSSSVKIINLSANVTGISLVSSAYNKGSYYKFIFVQDSIGGHIVNLYNATIKGNLPYVNTDPNSITVIELLELNNTFYFIYSNDIIKSTIDSIDGVSRGNFNSKLLYNGDNHLYSFCKDNNVFNLSIVEPSRIKFISYDDVNDSVFSTANTTYKIIGNVDLKGKTYNIGNNCKIDLSDGGFIQNGTIVLNNTVIYPTGLDLSIFMPNVTIEGNFIKGQSILDGISKRIKIWDGVNWFTANGENYSDIRGNTESRPTNINQGYCYYDTTLNKPIWWTGSKWIDATGTNV